jgi:hypothetical protein
LFSSNALILSLNARSLNAARSLLNISLLQKTLKNCLKTTGACWLAASALHAYNGHRDIEKQGPAYGIAASQAALGVACLWRAWQVKPRSSRQPAAA